MQVYSQPSCLTSNCTVVVFSVPGPVSSLSADSQVTSVILTWKAPSVDSGAITEYQVAYYRAEADEPGPLIDAEDAYKLAEANELVHTRDTIVEITELRPGTTHVVFVRAVSDAGAGSVVTIQATTEKIRTYT